MSGQVVSVPVDGWPDVWCEPGAESVAAAPVARSVPSSASGCLVLATEAGVTSVPVAELICPVDLPARCIDSGVPASPGDTCPG
jgi:hypothetical protein